MMHWCVGNTSIDMDPSGNVKPSPVRSRERIDGTVALVMAVGIAQTEAVRSVYEERPEFLVV